MRGKKDVTTFPDKPVSWIASLFRGLTKEYSCDYRVYTRKIYIVRGKLKNFKGDNNTSETYIGLTETDLKTCIEHCFA